MGNSSSSSISQQNMINHPNQYHVTWFTKTKHRCQPVINTTHVVHNQNFHVESWEKLFLLHRSINEKKKKEN